MRQWWTHAIHVALLLLLPVTNPLSLPLPHSFVAAVFRPLRPSVSRLTVLRSRYTCVVSAPAKGVGAPIPFAFSLPLSSSLSCFFLFAPPFSVPHGIFTFVFVVITHLCPAPDSKPDQRAPCKRLCVTHDAAPSESRVCVSACVCARVYGGATFHGGALRSFHLRTYNGEGVRPCVMPSLSLFSVIIAFFFLGGLCSSPSLSLCVCVGLCKS